MKINSRTIVMFVSIICSFMLLFATSSPIMNIASFFVLLSGAIIIVNFDIMHPFVNYLPLYVLYSTAYPIVYHTTYSYNQTLNKLPLVLQWVFMLTVIIVIGGNKVIYTPANYRFIGVQYINKLILGIAAIVMIAFVITVSGGGYQDKIEVNSSENLLINVSHLFFYMYLIVYAILYSNNLLKKKSTKKLVLFSSLLVISVFLFSGERDIVLRFLLITIFINHVIKKNFSPSKIILLGGVGLTTIPILARFKSFGLTGDIRYSTHNFFIELLQSEFIAASRNLQLIVEGGYASIFYGKTLINAMLRPLDYFIPFTTTKYSALVWNQTTFYPGRRTGMGFSIVAEGYVNYGFIGVILWGLILGVLFKILYRRSKLSLNNLIIYILSIPIFAYSTRADLANITSPIFKHIILPVFALTLIKKVLVKGKSKEELNE